MHVCMCVHPCVVPSVLGCSEASEPVGGRHVDLRLCGPFQNVTTAVARAAVLLAMALCSGLIYPRPSGAEPC